MSADLVRKLSSTKSPLRHVPLSSPYLHQAEPLIVNAPGVTVPSDCSVSQAAEVLVSGLRLPVCAGMPGGGSSSLLPLKLGTTSIGTGRTGTCRVTAMVPPPSQCGWWLCSELAPAGYYLARRPAWQALKV
jgi:hypothetical protein